MTKRIRFALVLCAFAALLLAALWLLLAARGGLSGDGIYFIREDGAMEERIGRAERPGAGLFGGGGENTPGDREARSRQYDQTKERRG